MTKTKKDPQREVALFRFQLIAEMVRLAQGAPELGEALRRQVAAGTLRNWLRLYGQGGFEALYPKRHVDRHECRSLPPEVAEPQLGIKESNPRLSVRLVMCEARDSGRAPESVDRRRFSYAASGELWQSDAIHGPKVCGCDTPDPRRVKTYLIAVIRDARRAVRRLRAGREHRAVPAGVQAGRAAARPAAQVVCRLSLQAPARDLHHAGHQPDPLAAVQARGARQDRTLLRHSARPQTRDRTLFLTLRSLYRKLCTSGLYDVVVRHFPAGEAPPKGRALHGLRCACARNLAESDQSFKEIGDHLGHSSPASIKVYAKVDLPALRQVALEDLGCLA